MPTGYTAGILDGTTKDFNEFARLCSRNFIIHLRDEPMSSKYKARTPSNYHSKEIAKAKFKLKECESLTDEEIIIKEKASLIESRGYHTGAKSLDEENKLRLKHFLEKAKAYKPPTKKHDGIAKFMVDQLEKTIDFDCNSNYHTDELEKINSRIENVNAEETRSEMKLEATKDIAYHTIENEEELKRCREHNKWYSDFIKSLME